MGLELLRADGRERGLSACTTMAQYADYSGWEYPPPNMYSADHMDKDGYLRVQGKLLKKGGSRRGSASSHVPSSDKAAAPRSSLLGSIFPGGRRNWSERYFQLDIDEGTWRYFSDREQTKQAGVVRLIPGRTKVVVPEEVQLRGRHAPSSTEEALNYFEVHPTRDEGGAERAAPFVVRAPTSREFEEWIRALEYALKKAEVRSRGMTAAAVDEAASAMNAAFSGFHDEGPDYSVYDGYRPRGQSPRQGGAALHHSSADTSGANSPRTPSSENMGFTQTAFLEMEYYYQDMDGEQRGPVGFDGLRNAFGNGDVDDVSYVYTNRSDEWIELRALPTLLRLLQPPKPPPKPKPPPPAPRPTEAEPRPVSVPPRTTTRAKPKAAPSAFRL